MTVKYQELAKTGDIRPSRFLSSIFVILHFYLFIGGIVGTLPLVYALISNREALYDPILQTDVMGFLNKYTGPVSNYIFTNLSIYCMLLGVFIAVKFIHNRPFGTLINPGKKFKWSRFFVGFLVFGTLIALGTLADYVLNPGSYTFSFEGSKFWVTLPLILIMTPLQSATEEFVFRGYVIQSFGVKIKNGVILSVISGILFTLPHLANPEVFASAEQGFISTLCMVLNYFVIGMAFALVTVRTNSLEAAIGAHTVNNLICFVLVGYPDNVLPTNTVFYTSNFDSEGGLISAIVTAALFYLITAALIRNRGIQQA